MRRSCQLSPLNDYRAHPCADLPAHLRHIHGRNLRLSGQISAVDAFANTLQIYHSLLMCICVIEEGKLEFKPH